MNRLVLLLLLSLSTLSLAANDYNQLEIKAARFYHYKEWPSALAMYQLMVHQRPEVAANYSHAIVAAGLCDNEAEQMRFLKQSMSAGIALDSIYNGVQTLAFEQGNAALYEEFLNAAAKSFPWLERNLDARLADYYCWRNDADGMIIYARKMLSITPENVNYLTVLADGLFMNGIVDEGIKVYRNILALDPDNYHSLLVLGNYYADLIPQNRSDAEAPVLARQYLSRAYAIKPTPYVKARIASLAD